MLLDRTAARADRSEAPRMLRSCGKFIVRHEDLSSPPTFSSLLIPVVITGQSVRRSVLVWLVLASLLTLVSGGAAMAAGLLGGTVLEIDVETAQVVLQMPEGHASLFAAATADVLKGLKVGDRVSIELDAEGRIVKVVKLPLDPGN